MKYGFLLISHMKTRVQIFLHDKWTVYILGMKIGVQIFYMKYGIFCFKYGNLTLDMLLWSTESLYYLYDMWTLILLRSMCNLLHVMYKYLGLDFPTWNTEFSVFVLLKYEDRLNLWKMKFFIFHTWKSSCRFSTWNMKFCTFLVLTY